MKHSPLKSMIRAFVLAVALSQISIAQWTRVPDIPAPHTVYALLAVHDTLYAGTDSVVYVGAHGATQWSAGVPPSGDRDFVSCLLKSGNVLLAGMFHNGVFRSTNEGASWQAFSAGLAGLGGTSISNLLVRRDSLIAGTFGEGVFITAADFAHPWTSWGDSLTDYEGQNVFKMFMVGNTVLAGAGANGYMFRYTDEQPWWNPIPMNTPRFIGETVSGFASDSTAVFAGTFEGIYRSTDQGLSWERKPLPLSPQTVLTLPLHHAATWYALVTTPLSASLFASSDLGESWSAPDFVPIPDVFAAAFVGDTVYLGGGDGLWKRPVSEILLNVDGRAPAPGVFRLYQNYPNPFNPTTTIRFDLPHAGAARLRIYDLLGRVVAEPVDGYVGVGAHNVTFDASRLASGMYFYRLEAGQLAETGRMLLLK